MKFVDRFIEINKCACLLRSRPYDIGFEINWVGSANNVVKVKSDYYGIYVTIHFRGKGSYFRLNLSKKFKNCNFNQFRAILT